MPRGKRLNLWPSVPRFRIGWREIENWESDLLGGGSSGVGDRREDGLRLRSAWLSPFGLERAAA